MQDTITIKGLPYSLKTDGWWLDPPKTPDPASAKGDPTRRPPIWVRTLLLTVLADLLFWYHELGLSLPLFLLAVYAVSVPRVTRASMILLTLALLPAAELVQPLSLTFALAGTLVAVVLAHHPKTLIWRSLMTWPGQWFRAVQATGQQVRWPGAGTLLRTWALPLGGAVLLAALLVEANPLLDHWTRQTRLEDLPFARLLFWGAMAATSLALLVPPRAAIPHQGSKALPEIAALNARSVLRALVTFNAVLAVQTFTDLAILGLGAALPPDMTLAEYAHRGAYPLLAVALLAGVFCLVAQRHIAMQPLARALMLLWILQNIAICAAAALRLDLYIESFGLTYLRAHALIWMGVVALGFGVMIWQMLRHHDHRWVLRRWAVLGVGVLYLCCFVNFAQIIARHNLTRPEPDLSYICSLGPQALEPLRRALQETPSLARDLARLHQCKAMLPVQSSHWLEWGFRDWRAARRLAAMTEAPT